MHLFIYLTIYLSIDRSIYIPVYRILDVYEITLRPKDVQILCRFLFGLVTLPNFEAFI
jgi:hypothetical protein